MVAKWHIALSIISFVALIFTVVIFVSPGIYHVDFIKYLKYEYPANGQGDVIITRYDYPPVDPNSGNYPQPSGTGESSTITWRYKKTSLFLGLWYFRTCVTTRTLEGLSKGYECMTLRYDEAYGKSYSLPSYMQGLTLEDVFQSMKDINLMFLVEFEVEIPAAFVAMIVGFVTAIVFFKKSCTSRRIGLTTFFSHLIAGVLFAVVTGRAAVYNAVAKKLLGGAFGFGMDGVSMGYPYSVMICGFSAILCFIFAVKVVLILTNKSTSKVEITNVENTACAGIEGTHPYRQLSVNMNEMGKEPMN